MTDIKPNRKRDIHLHFCVDEEERKLIQERMASAKITGLGAYMRKMAIDGYHVNIDLTEVKELVSLLRRCSNNLNQIAKLANSTHSIYQTDIEDLRGQLDRLWDATNSIMLSLAKIK